MRAYVINAVRFVGAACVTLGFTSGFNLGGGFVVGGRAIFSLAACGMVGVLLCVVSVVGSIVKKLIAFFSVVDVVIFWRVVV